MIRLQIIPVILLPTGKLLVFNGPVHPRGIHSLGFVDVGVSIGSLFGRRKRTSIVNLWNQQDLHPISPQVTLLNDRN